MEEKKKKTQPLFLTLKDIKKLHDDIIKGNEFVFCFDEKGKLIDTYIKIVDENYMRKSQIDEYTEECQL